METTSCYRALDFQTSPRPLLDLGKEFRGVNSDANAPPRACKNSNFLKGVKWAPDGSCLLSSSEDKILRLFNLPARILESACGSEEMPTGNEATSTNTPDPASHEVDALNSVVGIQEGELVYDYAWYPYMTSSNPQTCCIASTCRANPIHLWDVHTGSLRATYRAYNAVDEITAALCVSFSNDGSQIFAGYNKTIRIFETVLPGREYDTLLTHKKGRHGQAGLISCIAQSHIQTKLLAAGSYLGTVGLYSQDDGEIIALMDAHCGGVTQVLYMCADMPWFVAFPSRDGAMCFCFVPCATNIIGAKQVQFSRDGNFLYSGARKDPSIVCWDVRMAQTPVYTLTRASSSTNQRIQFDIEPCGRHLVSGGEDGHCRVFDLTTGELVRSIQVAEDTVNGVMLHPYAPLLATGSGHRRFIENISFSPPFLEGQDAYELRPNENSLKIWSLASHWIQYEDCGGREEKSMSE